jgi:hypothetical protein
MLHADRRNIILPTIARQHKGEIVENVAYKLRSETIPGFDVVVVVDGGSDRNALRPKFDIQEDSVFVKCQAINSLPNIKEYNDAIAAESHELEHLIAADVAQRRKPKEVAALLNQMTLNQ